MPIPDDYKDICQMLVEATRANGLKWTDERGTLGVQLPQFKLEMWSGTDEQNTEFVAVGLRDTEDNQLIDNWFLEEGDSDFPVLLELWKSARRQARGVQQKLDALRDFLKQGKRE